MVMAKKLTSTFLGMSAAGDTLGGPIETPLVQEQFARLERQTYSEMGWTRLKHALPAPADIFACPAHQENAGVDIIIL